MRCFRCYGYDGTTFDQLVHDSGLSRSSLRNAFGDKDRLYELALKRYTECKLAPTLEMLCDEKMGGDLLRSLIQKMHAPASAGSVDCLLFMTMLHNAAGVDEPKHLGRIRSNLTKLWHSIGNALSNLRKRRTKQLSNDERAAVLVGLIYGVKMISRNGKNKELVSAIANAAAKLVEGK